MYGELSKRKSIYIIMALFIMLFIFLSMGTALGAETIEKETANDNDMLASIGLDSGFLLAQDDSEPGEEENKLEITGLSTFYGSDREETELIIEGKNFIEGIIVRIGGRRINDVTFVSDREVIAIVPPSTLVGRDLNVQLENPDGQISTLENTFKYIATPIITNIVPNYAVIDEMENDEI
ncbi:MAG: hypothetical protein GX318_02035, partial [Clostridia bacterium]|nr:hypothetical protein [Clostridia bacterium]